MIKLPIKMIGLTLTLFVGLLLLGGCSLNRVGVGGSPVNFTAEPLLFCEGDPVTITWDATRTPRNPGWCVVHGREYSPPPACSSSNECPGGSGENACLDGYCCPSALYAGNPGACPTAAGCYPTFSLAITANTFTIDPPINERQFVEGERQVFPSETTDFHLRYTYAGLSSPEEFSRTVQRVSSDPAERRELHFPFSCNERNPAWQWHDMENPVYASENVQVIAVRNITPHIIQLSSTEPPRDPVTLRPGESTEVFNGAIEGGLWVASLSPLDRASLTRPRCTATGVENPWPDLAVEVTMGCPIDE